MNRRLPGVSFFVDIYRRRSYFVGAHKGYVASGATIVGGLSFPRQFWTMRNRSGRAEEIRERIRLVLLHEWDPIGVGDIPEAQDEYDSYVGGIYRLLASGASEYQIIERLYHLETVNMGLTGNRERLKPVAGKLAELGASL